MIPKLLQDVAVGGLSGLAAGGAAGGLVGGALGEKGERKESALGGARRGAILGAKAGVLAPIARAGIATVLRSSIPRQAGQIAKLQDLLNTKGISVEEATHLIGKIQDAKNRLAGSTAALETYGRARPLAEGAALTAGSTSTMAGLQELGKRIKKIRQGKSSKEKTASNELPNGYLQGLHVTLPKIANDPLSPEKGEPLATEIPSERRARRLAELLKRSVPTGTAEGSASPAPKRGTP